MNLVSCGSKHGLPESELRFSAKVLRNPYWIASLQGKNGKDLEVSAYVMADKDFVKIMDCMYLAIKTYAEIDPDFTCVIYCTGGKHRSVVCVECLAARFNACGIKCDVLHRDINKE
jgi:UPF0042 nucleotide-binding protein